MLDEKKVDRACDKFHNHFQHLYNKALPIKNMTITIYNSRYKPWITYGLLNSGYKKSRIYAIFFSRIYTIFLKTNTLDPSKNILTIKIK